MEGSKLSPLAMVLLLVGTAAGQSPFAPKVSGPLSQRVVAYQIDAKYDPAKHSLDATETLTYRNLTGKPLDRFPFHLYLNAFQPKSTWMHEGHRDGYFRSSDLSEWDEKDFGLNEVTAFEVVGMGDLTKQMKFVSPDDGNPDDKTVFEVHLPRPVAPGQSVTFKISFRAKFPELVARTGYSGNFLLAGQWFPKVGVWWQGAWNCHQFHAMTEFFADFGTYDVTITLPKNFVIGATGVQTSDRDNGNGTKTVAFHAEDVHDFAWTADPNFKVIDSQFDGSVGAVRIRLLTYTDHESSLQRYVNVARGSMQRFDEWYGPYPYAQLTVVDPPHGAGEAGGMEYPTFITGGTSWPLLQGDYNEPEGVTEHEFGHQYWYGMVATNEFENAWLDEGINSYTEIKVLDSLFGQHTSAFNLFGVQEGARGSLRRSYLRRANIDFLSRPSYTDMSASSYGAISYGKAATMLVTLEAVVGEQTLRKALHTYFMKYRFAHPTQEDFLRTVTEVAGQDLKWYWDQAVYGTQVMDYEVLRADSSPVTWYKDDADDKGGATYETQVILHRKGDFVFPVEAEIKFDNGERVREKWDGKDRWVRYVYRKKARIVSAQIDPDYRATMDGNYLNNSRTTYDQRLPYHKIAAYWMALTQFLAQVLSWLV
ncbi:MAG: M1 family metallopeptidase [Acidobacteriota bacterium]|nr:M1 family metallopeptidase [Acidobacteriota bacterium]